MKQRTNDVKKSRIKRNTAYCVELFINLLERGREDKKRICLVDAGDEQEAKEKVKEHFKFCPHTASLLVAREVEYLGYTDTVDDTLFVAELITIDERARKKDIGGQREPKEGEEVEMIQPLDLVYIFGRSFEEASARLYSYFTESEEPMITRSIISLKEVPSNYLLKIIL